MAWDLDAASSAVLRGEREPGPVLRLCVIELVARRHWTTEVVEQPRKLLGPRRRTQLVAGPPVPPREHDVPPYAQIDHLMRELATGGRLAPKELGPRIRERWGSPQAWLRASVLDPMAEGGWLRRKKTLGVTYYATTPDGDVRRRELIALLDPFKGRRGKQLVDRDPGYALAAAGALGAGVLLLDHLLPRLHELRSLGASDTGGAGFTGAGGSGHDGGPGPGMELEGIDSGGFDLGSAGDLAAAGDLGGGDFGGGFSDGGGGDGGGDGGGGGGGD